MPHTHDSAPTDSAEPGRRDYRAAHFRAAAGRFTVLSVPKYPDDADDPRGDELILVDGFQIGGTYACTGEKRDTWASYGPAGYSLRHPTRQAAIAVQVREYAIDPSLYDRIVADALAEEHAEQARQDAQLAEQHERREAQRRRVRLGDDEPGPTVLTVPAYHVFYAVADETQRVSQWLDAHGIAEASAIHEIRVEQRATRRAIVYEAPARSWNTGRDAPTETHVVSLTVDPPRIDTPARPDLHALLEEHWPTRFPLIDYGRSLACARCTRSWRDLGAGESLDDALAVWPCAPVAEAIASAQTGRAAEQAGSAAP